MFSAGAGVFFAGAGAGGEKPGVCTALRYCLKTLMVLILCYEKKLGWVLVKKNFFQMFFHFDHKHIEQPATIQRK